MLYLRLIPFAILILHSFLKALDINTSRRRLNSLCVISLSVFMTRHCTIYIYCVCVTPRLICVTLALHHSVSVWHIPLAFLGLFHLCLPNTSHSIELGFQNDTGNASYVSISFNALFIVLIWMNLPNLILPFWSHGQFSIIFMLYFPFPHKRPLQRYPGGLDEDVPCIYAFGL